MSNYLRGFNKEKITVNAGGKIGLFGAIFLILFGLKIAGYIDGWSWWWVTAPLWAPLAIGVFIFLVFGLLLMIFSKK